VLVWNTEEPELSARMTSRQTPCEGPMQREELTEHQPATPPSMLSLDASPDAAYAAPHRRCATGQHTQEKPQKPAAPAPAKPAIPIASVPAAAAAAAAAAPLDPADPKMTCVRCKQGFFCSDHQGGAKGTSHLCPPHAPVLYARLRPGAVQGWRACPHAQPGCPTHPWGATS